MTVQNSYIFYGFKNRYGQITVKETGYQFFGPVRVKPIVKPMMS